MRPVGLEPDSRLFRKNQQLRGISVFPVVMRFFGIYYYIVLCTYICIIHIYKQLCIMNATREYAFRLPISYIMTVGKATQTMIASKPALFSFLKASSASSTSMLLVRTVYQPSIRVVVMGRPVLALISFSSASAFAFFSKEPA